jgi:hypothetical protein
MPEATLTMRIRAIDEATSTIKRVKAEARESLGRASVIGGAVGGLVAGGVMVMFQGLQMAMHSLVDIGKKIFNQMVESSGYLKMSMKLWQHAINEIFRPIGDMIGMALMPSLLELTKTTRENYAEFLKNIRSGMSIQEALKIATEKNTEALGEFLTEMIPVLMATIDALIPLVSLAVEKLTPVIVDALIKIAPKVGEAIYNAMMGAAEDAITEAIEDATGWDLPSIPEMQPGQQQLQQQTTNDFFSGLGSFFNDVWTGKIWEPGWNLGWDRPSSVPGVGAGAGATVQNNFYAPVYGKEDIDDAVDRALQRNYSKIGVI